MISHGIICSFEEIKREIQRILIYECRCNDRLNMRLDRNCFITATACVISDEGKCVLRTVKLVAAVADDVK